MSENAYSLLNTFFVKIIGVKSDMAQADSKSTYVILR
jgi:hypothetical protein